MNIFMMQKETRESVDCHDEDEVQVPGAKEHSVMN
jgi:hypothetical protein